MRKIALTQNKYALIDNEDYEFISLFKWHASCIGKTFYAQARISGKIVYMHRLLLGLTADDKKCVDHINHNGLDNRRTNIRVCTRQQNQQYRKIQSNCGSGLKGAYRCTKSKTWMSRICVHGKDIYLGTFKTKYAAHNAYKKAAKEYFGEFCCV